MDGAGSYSVAHSAGLLPTELTGMWGWILLRSPHQGKRSPPPPPSLSNGLLVSPCPLMGVFWASHASWQRALTCWVDLILQGALRFSLVKAGKVP